MCFNPTATELSRRHAILNGNGHNDETQRLKSDDTNYFVPAERRAETVSSQIHEVKSVLSCRHGGFGWDFTVRAKQVHN